MYCVFVLRVDVSLTGMFQEQASAWCKSMFASREACEEAKDFTLSMVKASSAIQAVLPLVYSRGCQSYHGVHPPRMILQKSADKFVVCSSLLV